MLVEMGEMGEKDRRPYLAIDTSTALGSVAVGRGDRLLAEVVVGVMVRHSEALLPAIDFALRSAGVEPAGLGGVVVGAGPGSFTGVRVAGATAKGMVRVLDVPFFAYSGLQALAAGVGAGVGARGSAGGETGARPICALFDARREEVYAACYDFSGTSIETILEPTVLPLGEVLEELRGVAPIYAGDGALRYRVAIEGAGGGVAPAFYAVPRGGALLWLADTEPAAGRVDDPAAWEPEYLRAAGAERGAPR
jgi:tRNA threonylcarbamoyladenosine biosynthesis protein TsaB